MAQPQTEIRFTVEEYLSRERVSPERHEFLDGLIYAMAGESPEHGTICMNLSVSVGSQLKKTRCQAWSKDAKVRSGPEPSAGSRKGLYSYPDIVIFCGEPRFADDHRDILTNPSVVIEVLSPTTEAFDRGEKFLRYQTWNPTMTDYLLVSQKLPMISHFSRREGGDWSYRVFHSLDQSLTIEAIGCTLSLTEVYDRIVFPEEPEENGGDET